MLYHILPFIRENKWRLIISIFLLIIIDLLALITPWLLGNIIDGLGELNLSDEKILEFVLWIFAIEAALLIMRFFMRTQLNRAAYDIEYKIRTAYFSHLLKLDSEFYLEQKTGDLMARATNDINAITTVFSEGLLMFVDSILIIFVVLFITISFISVDLTLISIINLPVLAFFIIVLSPIVGKRFKKMNESFGSLSEKTREFISGIRLLKAFNREGIISKVFQLESLKLYKDSVRVQQVIVGLNPLIRVIAYTSTIIAVFYGGELVLKGSLSLGKFSSFLTYLQRLTWPFMAIGFLISILQMGFASLSRLNYIFNQVPRIDDSKADTSITEIEPSISVRNLSFQYPGAKVPSLKHISFELGSGKTLGIIGRTGSGKSTLAELLVRRYDTIDSHIFLGDIPIKKIPLSLLHQTIGYAFQESQIFSASIAENIAINSDSLEMDKIRYYAKIACLDEDVMKMEEGYDTELGERGVNLSGGQKQRLSIARSLYPEPKIVILDDSLSAVDNRTMMKILHNLKFVLKDRTAIIISHRISSVMDADEIIVLDEGFMVQKGRHQDLIAQEGLYKELYEIQNISEEA